MQHRHRLRQHADKAWARTIADADYTCGKMSDSASRLRRSVTEAPRQMPAGSRQTEENKRMITRD